MKEQRQSFNDQFNDSKIDNIIKTPQKGKENLDSKDNVGTLIENLYKLVSMEDTYGKLNSLIYSYWTEEQESDDSKEKKNIERDKYHLKWTFTNKGGKDKPNLDDEKWKENWIQHLKDLYNLYEVGDKLYTLSIYDIISNVIKMLHDLYGDNHNPIKPYYDDSIVLGEILYKHDFTPQGDGSSEIESPNINITKSYLHKLDGMDSLLVNLGDKKFIELAIAGSFFFDPGLVKKEIGTLSVVFSVAKNKISELLDPDVNLNRSIDFGEAEKDVKDFVSKKILEIETEQKDNLQKVNKLINSLTVEKFKEYLLSNLNFPESKEKKLVYLANQFRKEIKKVGESTPQDDNQILKYLKDKYNPTKKTLDGLKNSPDKLNEYLADMQLAKLDIFRDKQIKKNALSQGPLYNRWKHCW